MAKQSKKRALDDITEPPTKRHKTNQMQIKQSSNKDNDIIQVKFAHENCTFPRKQLMQIQFCQSKLNRWVNKNNNNQDNKQQDDDIQTPNIDFRSFYPKLTNEIFTIILKLNQILNKSNNNNNNNDTNIEKAVNLLLSEKLNISKLSLLLDASSMLLETKIFNQQIFSLYFQKHTPLLTINQLNNLMKYIPNNKKIFTQNIINKQISTRNVMDNYFIHKTIYNRCNKLKKLSYPLSSTPDVKYAIKYIVQQLKHELSRETWRRLFYHHDQEQDHQLGTCSCSPCDRDELEEELNYGIIMAFDHIYKYADVCHLNDFDTLLTEYFDFIEKTFRKQDWGYRHPEFDHDQWVFGRIRWGLVQCAYLPI